MKQGHCGRVLLWFGVEFLLHYFINPAMVIGKSALPFSEGFFSGHFLLF
jgi:hypothetical protein